MTAMNEQIGPVLVLLLIVLAGWCVVFGLAAYDSALSGKQRDDKHLGAILYTTVKWIFLILVAVCIVCWAFY
uniref:hypothetical protein n=1 Tax=Pseudomonas syringae TaxID=317 RepID=UPI001E319271|nr:hypothetical protein [Pseudomonas syringae]QOQ33562.1 hypothetical protein [Pseudomonas syringae pv. actinidiae]